MKHYVDVTQTVEVEVDESKFTPEFMESFQRSFYPFETVGDHIKYIAQLEARGLTSGIWTRFIEGYGDPKDFGIVVKLVDCYEEFTD